MKNITSGLLLMAVLLCVVKVSAQVPQDDVQLWNEVFLSIPMSKKVDFVLGGNLRVGDNLTQPFDARWGIGFVFKFNKYVSFHPLFLHREATPPGGRPEREERITLAGTVRIPLGKFTLSDRTGFERRERTPQLDSWRFRNRVQLEHPFTIRKKKFTFFISDEVFYDFLLNDWVRNRALIGAGHAFNKHFTGELYYMRQNDGRSRPGDLHVIGTAMKFKL